MNTNANDFPEEKNPTSTDKKKYYENIPFSDEQKKEANEKIEEAYFNVGKIYYDPLKEYKESIKNLEYILKRFSNTKFEPQILFYLSKNYTSLKIVNKSNEYKDLLSKKYPNSSYNTILNKINDTTSKIESNESKPTETNKIANEIEDLYRLIYNAYKNDNIEEVKRIKKIHDEKNAGNALQYKFDFIYAQAIGKTGNVAEYTKLLNSVVSDYPGSDVSNSAQYILNYLKNKESKSSAGTESKFKVDKQMEHYTLVAVPLSTNINKFKNELANYNELNNSLVPLQITNSVLGTTHQLVIVKGFENTSGALKYVSDLTINEKLFKETNVFQKDIFAISEENFKQLMIDKSLKNYLDFYKNNY